ncbi:MAG: TRAP transporter TatT component family protein [Myxococcota bacterium]
MRSLTLSALLFVAACGGKHPGTYETAKAGDGAAADPVIAEADALWDERVDAAKLEMALKKYEEAYTADPANRHALVRLTRGWYFYGDGHATDKDVQIERWGKAIEWGAKCLALNEEFATRVNSGEKEKDAVAVATKNEVPCLYWTASALGKFGKAQGLAKTLKFLPTVKAYMTKVEELDPQYYHYGPARYWGAYYAALPSFAGQDLDKSKQYFDAAIEGAPYYLPTQALRAEFWAIPAQDPKQFKTDLDNVIAADANAKPEVAPENTLEQRKAKLLLEKMNEFFDKKAMAEMNGTQE